MEWIGRQAWKFGADRGGVIAIMFAVMIVPIMTAMAVAVDLGQFLVMKQQLQAAIDAAALDIGGQPTLSDAAATAEAKAFMTANYPALTKVGTITSITVTRSPTSVVIAATASMTTNFLQIIGYTTLGVSLNSTIAVKVNKLELVLVLDNTGSMAQNYGSMTGIAGLQTASTALVQTLFASDPTGQYVKVAVVPFTAAVNVGTQYGSASWIDTTGAGSLTRENLNIPAGQGLVSFAKNLTNVSWGGCVRQRNEPYDLQDLAPTASIPDTLFTPYFAPSEPSGLYNHYLNDGTFPNGTSQAAKQYSVTKYTNGYASNLPSLGPNFSCALQPIIPLTNNQSTVLAEIASMKASGATVIPAGLTWGWHLLSPTVSSVLFPSYAAASYSDTSTIKIILLLTDGQADVQLAYNYNPPTATTNGFDQSIFNAYGYGSGPHLNILPLPSSLNGIQDRPDYNLDQKEIQLCKNIKAVKDAYGNTGRIQIYAIGFGTVIDSSSLNILQQCATSSSTYFYNATSNQLIATFKTIAAGLSNLRISR